MKMKSSAIFLITALILMLSTQLVSQEPSKEVQEDNSWMLWENNVGRRWLMYHLEKDDVAKLKEKWDEVGASLKSGSSKYAGTYYVSDWMSGYFLRWSPSAGYIFVRYFDVEHPCYFSYGRVEEMGTSISFIHQGEASHSRCPTNNTGRPDTAWVAALGGEYLIPRSEASRFADFYGGFGEYNGYLRTYEAGIPFAFRWGEKETKKEDFVLPGDLARHVRWPLTGEIISVGKKRTRNRKTFLFDSELETVTPVAINVGSINGLRNGQEFVLLTDDDGRSETLIVTKVGRRRSGGIVVRTVWENNEGYFGYNYEKKESELKPFRVLKAGIKLSTSPESKL